MAVVKCPECGKSYNVKDETSGKVKCKCGAVIDVAAAKSTATTTKPGAKPSGSDLDAIKQLKSAYDRIQAEIGKVIVGQDRVVEETLIALFAQGHCLLEGVPGLAKTLLVSSLARALSLSFHRIQFTPDLMPSDITGTEILQEDPETRIREFKFLRGPVFSNMLLADEINRTPPKTQAALLEAMQEKKISIGGDDHMLDLPFLVMATQNPLEQEGTYPLPEAQLDRFLFKVFVDYPTDGEELEIMKRVSSPGFGTGEHSVEPVLGGEEILGLQDVVLRVPVADHVYSYAKKIVRSSRPDQPEAPEFVKNWVSWGAGPRASIYLIIAGKARAILRGQFHVSPEDVSAVALPVLRHRIACNFTAQAEGVTSDTVVQRLLETISKTEKFE